jgi:hypothetical protein
MVRCRHCDAGNCAGEGPVADVLFQYRFSRSAGEGPVGAEPDLAKRQQGRAQADVNAFNDFYLINGIGKLKVRFNGQLQNLGQVALPGWLGVAQYSNHEILYDLQLGFQQVKANYNIPNARAGRVTIYKTLNTGQIVYDYAVQISPTSCQEYLFTPLTQGFQLGFRVNGFMSLGLRGGSSAGRLGRT